MPSYVTPKINTEFIFYTSLVSQSDTKTFQANPTIAAGDFKVSTDGGALGNLTTLPTVTPASGKMVKITLSAAEMNGDNITVVCSDAAGSEWADQTINIQTTSNQIDDIHSDTTIIASDVVLIYSDTTAIHSQTTVIESDSVVIESSVQAIETDTGNIYSDTTILVSDTTAIHSDTTIITSDVVLIYSDTTAIHSQTTVIESDSVTIQSSLVVIESQTTVIESNTEAIHSQTTVIESDTVVISSQTTVIESDTTVIESVAPSDRIAIDVTFTGGTTTTAVLGNVDGSAASSVDDYYNGAVLIFNSGTLENQRTDITDYVGSTKTATITAVTTAVTGSHTAILV